MIPSRGALRHFAAVLCLAGFAGAVRGQCYPGIIEETPPAGPGHLSKQILRYDRDGAGPEQPMLVSLGGPGVTSFHGVRALDYADQRWYSPGEATMVIDIALCGVAYGATAQDDGPFLAVTAGPGSQSSTPPLSPPGNRVYVFDGASWQRLPDLPGYAGRAITSIDPDGDGPRPRTLAVVMDWYEPLENDTPSLCQVMMLEEDGTWRGVGGTQPSGGRLLSWDPDGADGPQHESLYFAYTPTTSPRTWCSKVDRWDGTEWVSLDISCSTVNNIRTVDFDGAGPELAKLALIGRTSRDGRWMNAPIAVFDGEEWEAIPGPSEFFLRDAILCPDGSILAEGGASSGSSEFLRFVRTEGVWSQKQRVLPRNSSGTGVSTLAVIRDDGDPRGYRTFGTTMDHSAGGGLAEIPPLPVVNSSTFFLFTPGRGFNGRVTDAAVLPDGSLVVTGDFTSVDGILSPFIAKRDSAGRWHSMWDSNWGSVPWGLSVLRDGRVLATRVWSIAPPYTMQHDGESWTPYAGIAATAFAERFIESDNGIVTLLNYTNLATGAFGDIAQLREGNLTFPGRFLDNPLVVVLANGDLICSVASIPTLAGFETGLAHWDGNQWTALGTGDQRAKNLRLLDDGTLVGITQANRISRWNGESWAVDPRLPTTGLNSTWLYWFDVVGPNTFIGAGSIRDPGTGFVSSAVYINDNVWEGVVAGSGSSVSSPKRALALPDGTALILGDLRLNGLNHVPTHYGIYQLSACNTCSPCVADWDESGGVDFADVAAFFVDYEQGNRCADVDDSTGVDATDMAIFFTAYEAGGC